MDVMVTNVAGQPGKELRKLVKSGAFNGCDQKIPIFLPAEVSMFVLMLDVKEPKCDDAEKSNNGKLDE